MKDDARLLFVRSLRGFEPADDRAEAWMRRATKIGETVAIEPPRKPRNVRHHRLYWALVSLVHDNLDTDLYPDPEALHQALKICAGLRTELTLPDGRVGFIPGSIAFHKMDQAAFATFYDRICDIVCRHFLPGVSNEELRAEVESMVGANYAESYA